MTEQGRSHAVCLRDFVLLTLYERITGATPSVVPLDPAAYLCKVAPVAKFKRTPFLIN